MHAMEDVHISPAEGKSFLFERDSASSTSSVSDEDVCEFDDGRFYSDYPVRNVILR